MLFFLGFMLYLQSWGGKLKISLFFYDGNAKKRGGKDGIRFNAHHHLWYLSFGHADFNVNDKFLFDKVY